MDYLAFTKIRTQFLRSFFTEASRPFNEIRRKIEAYEDPFETPPAYEDSEPPFLSEWQDAGDALDVIGQSTASLLAQTLKLYIEHWIDELRQRAGDKQLADVGVGLPTDSAYRAEFRKGWLAGYRAYCERLGVDWTRSPVDLTLLEQLILARNAVQHSGDITSVRVRQTKADASRYPRGFFADEFDIRWNDSLGQDTKFVRPPHLDISSERLSRAIDEVDAFCSWLDNQHPMRPTTRSVG